MKAMKHKLVNAFNQVKAYIKAHQRASIAVGVVIFLGLIFLIGSVLAAPNEEVSRTEPTVTVKEEPKPVVEPKVPSPLSGVQVTKAQASRPVTAIIIENSPDARPQSSINEAGVVFESIAEGGITRYLAFYQENRPDPIGPVRSLRPYFSDWIMAFDASIAHIGGSAEALAEVRPLGIKDLDQFAYSGSYYRTTDRFAPHNVYTDFDKLDALNKRLGFTSSDFDSFPRKVPKAVAKPRASSISVNISSYTYRSDYVWGKNTNTYKRSIAGVPEKDRETGKRIAPSVVIVIETNFTVSGDGRYHYDLVGTGKATVFQDGTVQVGSWSKAKRDAQMTFTNDTGNKIKLNPGLTWITAISPSQEVQYTP